MSPRGGPLRLTPQGVLAVVVLAVGLGFLGEVLLLTSFARGPVGVDFNHTYEAARAILHGRSPYLGAYVNAPSLAVLVIPLTVLPKPIAYLVFEAGSITAVSVLAGLLARGMGWSRPVLVALLVTTSWTAFLSFWVGKPEAFLFAATVGALLLIWRRAFFWAGTLGGCCY